MKNILMMVIVTTLVLAACGQVVEEKKEDDKKTEVEIVEEPIESVEPIVDYYGELITSLENGDMIEIDRLMKEFMLYLSYDESDDIITKYIYLLKDSLGSMIAEYYSEENFSIHGEINEKREFELVGNDKYELVGLIEEENFNSLIKRTFENGYGLACGEGAYYPVIDYVVLYEQYGENVTDPVEMYLRLMSENLLRPTIVEEYLNLSPLELAKRAIEHESFLKKHPGFVYKEDIRIGLMVALYKLSGPNVFDGMLDEDFTFTDELKEAYEYLLTMTDYPVTHTTVQGVLDFSLSKDGVLGELEDMDDMYDNTFKLHGEASEMIDELYMK